MQRRRKWDELADEDPAAGLLNLFDVWIAFAVALLLAMVSYMSVPELMNAKSDVTVIKNPGAADMEIIQKKGVKIVSASPASSVVTRAIDVMPLAAANKAEPSSPF